MGIVGTIINVGKDLKETTEEVLGVRVIKKDEEYYLEWW